MTLAYLVQHAEKEPLPGDPGLTGTGREQATCTGRWFCGLGMRALYSSPMRRARETAEGIASVTGLEVRADARLRERLNWDGSMPAPLLAAGIPPCAVTAVDDRSVVMIASVTHLGDQGLPGEGFHGQLVVLPDAAVPGEEEDDPGGPGDLAAGGLSAGW